MSTYNVFENIDKLWVRMYMVNYPPVTTLLRGSSLTFILSHGKYLHASSSLLWRR